MQMHQHAAAIFIIILTCSFDCVLVCMAFAPRITSQLMTLQSTMADAESIVASRGNRGDVVASELRSHAEALDQKLAAVLSAGLPDADPVVADAKKLAKTLGKMRIEVQPRHCVYNDANKLAIV